MDIGVLTVTLGDRPLEDALDYVADLDVDAVTTFSGLLGGSESAEVPN